MEFDQCRRDSGPGNQASAVLCDLVSGQPSALTSWIGSTSNNSCMSENFCRTGGLNAPPAKGGERVAAGQGCQQKCLQWP